MEQFYLIPKNILWKKKNKNDKLQNWCRKQYFEISTYYVVDINNNFTILLLLKINLCIKLSNLTNQDIFSNFDDYTIWDLTVFYFFLYIYNNGNKKVNINQLKDEVEVIDDLDDYFTSRRLARGDTSNWFWAHDPENFRKKVAKFSNFLNENDLQNYFKETLLSNPNKHSLKNYTKLGNISIPTNFFEKGLQVKQKTHDNIKYDHIIQYPIDENTNNNAKIFFNHLNQVCQKSVKFKNNISKEYIYRHPKDDNYTDKILSWGIVIYKKTDQNHQEYNQSSGSKQTSGNVKIFVLTEYITDGAIDYISKNLSKSITSKCIKIPGVHEYEPIRLRMNDLQGNPKTYCLKDDRDKNVFVIKYTGESKKDMEVGNLVAQLSVNDWVNLNELTLKQD